METKIGRFITLLMKEKTQKFFAITLYISFILMFMQIDLPIILMIIWIVIMLLGWPMYISKCMIEINEKNEEQLGKNLKSEIKKIAKEILMFIPILLISYCVTFFMMVGKPANQTGIEQFFYEAPISSLILIIIVGPIIEEFIFRFMPYSFIKNKILYIIISTVVFAAMHVINDSNALNYIWFYMMRPLYYGYRYYKTKDILVPISMHSFNNLIAILLLIFS